MRIGQLNKQESGLDGLENSQSFYMTKDAKIKKQFLIKVQIKIMVRKKI